MCTIPGQDNTGRSTPPTDGSEAGRGASGGADVIPDDDSLNEGETELPSETRWDPHAIATSNEESGLPALELF